MTDQHATGHDAAELLELLCRQRELYRDLRRLACSQRELIAAEDPAGLLNLLAQRQKLIDQLAEINGRLGPARADWRRVEALMTDSQRQEAQAIVEQVQQLLAEILQADEADSKTLSARKEVIGRQIRTTTAGAQVQAAYRKTAGPIGDGKRSVDAKK